MADERLFSVELVTPERVLLTGMAAEVITRTGEGDASFLAGHTPLVGTLEPGVIVVVRAEGDEERVANHGGFVQVEQGVDSGDAEGTRAAGGTRVTLLIGVAELATEIDTERAQSALEGAQARISELGAQSGRGSSGAAEQDEPEAELVEAEAALRRAQVRLEAAEATSVAAAGAGSP
jgi:F-type H+-transporting ATPase subunit epsilon